MTITAQYAFSLFPVQRDRHKKFFTRTIMSAILKFYKEGAMKFESLEDALRFAIEKEKSANLLYIHFQDIVKDMAAKKLLQELANQELQHRQLIENAMNKGDISAIGEKKATDEIGFSDFMSAGSINSMSDPQDVMQYALKMESSSYDLYKGLLDNYRGTQMESLFDRLAQEELTHKNILEEQYEKHFAQWM
ncbi:MAG: ferritin family protein [Syntrophales bacterium]|jgi:rubrerythrin|nr:ferritin family protein [Syntrophales bacterium]